ncbi:MAG: hypothetical protein QM736_25680 [Vicinamibacterales bacterium]
MNPAADAAHPEYRIQQRHDDRHVAAANRHHEMDAEEARDHGHDAEPRHPGRPFSCDEEDCERDHRERGNRVECVSSGQEERLAADAASQFQERDHRSCERHCPDEHADVDLAEVHAASGNRFVTRHEIVGVAHEDGREPHEAVEDGHELRHRRHRHTRREHRADRATDRDDDGQQAERASGETRRALPHDERGNRAEHGDRHADDAPEIALPRTLL